jgi:hypothetical protein
MILLLLLLFIIFIVTIVLIILNLNKKKKVKKKKVDISKILIKCKKNEKLLNNKCVKKENNIKCDYGFPKFEKLSDDKLSCIEMNDEEKEEYCNKSSSTLKNGECVYVKTKEDCKNEFNEFYVPNSNDGTSCVLIDDQEKEKICEKKNKVHYDGKCLSKAICNENYYLTPDDKTNFTSCKSIDNPIDIAKICEKNNLAFVKNSCLPKKTENLCSLQQSGNDTKFKKKLDENFQCRDLTKEEKIRTCERYNHIFDEKNNKCICGEKQTYYKGQCVGKFTDQECFNKKQFTEANPYNDGRTCSNMSQNNKIKHCRKQGKEYVSYQGTEKCATKVTDEFCKSKYVSDQLFKMKPNDKTNFTTCRNLNLSEKRNICLANSDKRYWDGTNCLIKLKKPIIKLLGTVEKYDVKIQINITDTIDLPNSTINYEIFNNTDVSNPIKYENSSYAIINYGANKIYFKISSLEHNTKYKLRLKLETNNIGYETPFSDFLTFKTNCDKTIFTNSHCKKIYGPINNSNVSDSKKDPNVKNWPFFKIPNINNCGCTEMSENAAKEYCINNFYPSFKSNGLDVEFKGNNCVPKLSVVGPPLYLSIKNLDVNLDNDGNNIINPSEYITDKPYRILIQWRQPDLNIYNSELIKQIYPTKYKIYRRNADCNYTNEDDCENDPNCKIKSSRCVVKGISTLDNCETFANLDDDLSNFILIKTITVDDRNIINFKYVDGVSNTLEANKRYSYKIEPINIKGAGSFAGISITSIPIRKQANECSTKNKDGFPMKLNILSNCCVPTSASERQTICSNRKSIQDDLPNKYDPTTKKCVALVNYVLPGIPLLSIIKKTATSIELRIRPNAELGTPVLTDFELKWKNISTSETGRLTHNSEYIDDQINIAGSESLGTFNYVKPNSADAKKIINIVHQNLNPATKYEYSIRALSINDLWINDKNTNMFENSKKVGKSNIKKISGTTKFSVPIELPQMDLLELTNKKIKLLINQFKIGKEGGSRQKSNRATITYYKIIKHIVPNGNDASTYFHSNPVGTEIIIDLSRLSVFNAGSEIYKINYNIANKNYQFIDLDIQPNTIYKYTLYAKNNKIDQYSTANSYKLLDKTATESPITICENPKNINITQSYSDTVNKINLIVSWDRVIDPNIEKYKGWPGTYTPKSTYPKYDIYINNTIIKNDITNNTVNINNIYSINQKNLKLKIIAKHQGKLILNNGFELTINSNNDNENTTIINFNTLKIEKDEECNKNSSYYTNITSSLSVPYYLDNLECKSRRDNVQKMVEYCKSAKGDNYVYFNSKKQCIIPKDGEWKEQTLPAQGSTCHVNGIDGDEIVCGTAKRIKKKYKYIEPDIDTTLTNNGLDNLNGVDTFITLPEYATHQVTDGDKRIAYQFENCATAKCEDLCSLKNGGLKYIAYTDNTKTKEKPLSESQLSNKDYCLTDAEKSYDIIDPTETCPSCGNRNEGGTVIKKHTQCIDGMLGNENAISCKKHFEINKKPYSEEKITNGVFEEGKYYKCHGKYIPDKGIFEKADGYPDICSPPQKIDYSIAIKDEDGNPKEYKRDKYFKINNYDCGTNKSEADFPFCQFKVPQFTEILFDNLHCGTETQTKDIVCLGPNNEEQGDLLKCGGKDGYPKDYSGDNAKYKLTKTIEKTKCKEMCENKNHYWNDPNIDNKRNTRKDYNSKCESRVEIQAELSPATIVTDNCGTCKSVSDDTNTITYKEKCEDGAFGPAAATDCTKKFNTEFTQKTFNKISNTKNHETYKKVPIYESIYSKTCNDAFPNKPECKLDYGECSHICGSTDSIRSTTCLDDNRNGVPLINCSTPTDLKIACNRKSCKDKCEDENKFYTGTPSDIFTKDKSSMYNSKCVYKKTDEDCNILQSTEGYARFKKKLDSTTNKCRQQTDEEMTTICKSLGLLYNKKNKKCFDDFYPGKPRFSYKDETKCENDSITDCGYPDIENNSFCIDGLGFQMDGGKYVEEDKCTPEFLSTLINDSWTSKAKNEIEWVSSKGKYYDQTDPNQNKDDETTWTKLPMDTTIWRLKNKTKKCSNKLCEWDTDHIKDKFLFVVNKNTPSENIIDGIKDNRPGKNLQKMSLTDLLQLEYNNGEKYIDSFNKNNCSPIWNFQCKDTKNEIVDKKRCGPYPKFFNNTSGNGRKYKTNLPFYETKTWKTANLSDIKYEWKCKEESTGILGKWKLFTGSPATQIKKDLTFKTADYACKLCGLGENDTKDNKRYVERERTGKSSCYAEFTTTPGYIMGSITPEYYIDYKQNLYKQVTNTADNYKAQIPLNNCPNFKDNDDTAITKNIEKKICNEKNDCKCECGEGSADDSSTAYKEQCNKLNQNDDTSYTIDDTIKLCTSCNINKCYIKDSNSCIKKAVANSWFKGVKNRDTIDDNCGDDINSFNSCCEEKYTDKEINVGLTWSGVKTCREIDKLYYNDKTPSLENNITKYSDYKNKCSKLNHVKSWDSMLGKEKKPYKNIFNWLDAYSLDKVHFLNSGSKFGNKWKEYLLKNKNISNSIDLTFSCQHIRKSGFNDKKYEYYLKGDIKHCLNKL